MDLNERVKKARAMAAEELGVQEFTRQQRKGYKINDEGIRMNFLIDGMEFVIDYTWEEVDLEIQATNSK